MGGVTEGMPARILLRSGIHHFIFLARASDMTKPNVALVKYKLFTEWSSECLETIMYYTTVSEL